ncbi:MAG: cation-efflux pump [FCB group bacterium]|nr:cation-efflux pump [FCB group bacterium]
MHTTNEKKSVAAWSILAAVFLIAGKTTVGLLTGSLAILTDAIHSLLDMGASVITYFAVRISDKPADGDHHFGHGKVESLAALIQVLLLTGTCVFVGYEAIDRLRGTSEAEVSLSIWAYLVIVVSIAIDFTRVRALRRVAKKYSSKALEADALNFSTDIYSSLVVLFGLAAVNFGFSWADPLAAIGVAIFIISATIRMAKDSIDVLLDRAPAKADETIRSTVVDFPEILRIDRLRLRSDGRMTFAEMTLDIDRSLSFGGARDVVDRLNEKLKKRLPSADVTVTFNPASKDSEKIADTVRFVVNSFGYDQHHLIINRGAEGYFVSMHIEMPGEFSLDQSHRKATEITAKLHEAIEELDKAVIHTEPHGTEKTVSSDECEECDDVAARIRNIVESFPGVDDCHNIVLTPHQDGLALSADMRLDGSMPLDKTHKIADEVENKLKSEIPQLLSITLHLEPLK